MLEIVMMILLEFIIRVREKVRTVTIVFSNSILPNSLIKQMACSERIRLSGRLIGARLIREKEPITKSSKHHLSVKQGLNHLAKRFSTCLIVSMAKNRLRES